MKTPISILVFIVFSHCLSAQIQFTKSIRMLNWEGKNNFQQTSDGGYILCTDSDPTMDTVDALPYCYLIKMDATGVTQWVNKFPKSAFGSTTWDGNSVIQTSDGGYIIATGSYYNPTTCYMYLIRTDNLGNEVWSRTYPGFANSRGYCIQQTTDLGYVISGVTFGNNYSMPSLYILKTDNQGIVQWGKYYIEAPALIGGTVYSIKQIANGGYVGCGRSYTGAVLFKTNNLGVIQWIKTSGSGSEAGYDVQETQNGDFITAGTGIVSGYYVATLTRVDTGGNVIWTKGYRMSAGSDDIGYAVVETQDGFSLLGNSDDSMRTWLIHVDTAGNPLWGRKYYDTRTSYRIVHALSRTNDGGYAFVSQYLYYASPERNVVFIKTNGYGYAACNDAPFTPLTVNYVSAAPVVTKLLSATNHTSVITIMTPTTITDSICNNFNPKNIEDGFLSEENLLIFPNPTNSTLSISLSGISADYVHIRLYNSLGQIIIDQKEMLQGDLKVDLSMEKVSSGIYFVSVETDDGRMVSRKVLRE